MTHVYSKDLYGNYDSFAVVGLFLPYLIYWHIHQYLACSKDLF